MSLTVGREESKVFYFQTKTKMVKFFSLEQINARRESEGEELFAFDISGNDILLLEIQLSEIQEWGLENNLELIQFYWNLQPIFVFNDIATIITKNITFSD